MWGGCGMDVGWMWMDLGWMRMDVQISVSFPRFILPHAVSFNVGYLFLAADRILGPSGSRGAAYLPTNHLNIPSCPLSPQPHKVLADGRPGGAPRVSGILGWSRARAGAPGQSLWGLLDGKATSDPSRPLRHCTCHLLSLPGPADRAQPREVGTFGVFFRPLSD